MCEVKVSGSSDTGAGKREVTGVQCAERQAERKVVRKSAVVWHIHI